MMRGLIFVSAVAACVASAPVGATVISTLPDGVALPMPAIEADGVKGPYAVAPGVTWSATTSRAAFGVTYSWGFTPTFAWEAGTPLAGINGYGGSMSFTFDTPVSAILGDFGWILSSDAPATILSIYDSNNALLESVTLAKALASYYDYGFHGFERDSNEIAKLTISGPYVAVRNLSTVTLAVPEAGTWASMIVGMGLIGGVLRRRRAVAATA